MCPSCPFTVRLKSKHSGFSLQSGRLCVVLPASQQGPPKGILLGSSPGGGAFYIEPPSAVPLNNDLAAAKGEAAAAVEKVLWQLTGRIIDNQDDLQASLDMVRLTCAGSLAQCLDVPTSCHCCNVTDDVWEQL